MKKKSILLRIATILLIISVLCAGYITYYKTNILLTETEFNGEPISLTDEEKSERDYLILKGERKIQIIEKKLEQAEPVCALIDFVCFLGLISLLIASIIYKEESNTKWIIVLYMIVNLYLLFGYL